jgi:hypothetical protein
MSSNTATTTPAKGNSKKPGRIGSSARIVRDLKEFYSKKLLPIEKACMFHKFHNPELLDRY